MPCQISFRDVIFTPSETGVRVQVWTDVPSHLYLRLSTTEPQIHKKSVTKRGLPQMEDYRYCFVAYEDNEQYEDGDTLTHTWWKPDWPVCTTKWGYFWGSRAGEVCVSTSPVFKYHNNGVAPVPPPDTMHELNPIDPEYHAIAGGVSWTLQDVSRDVPEGATGVLLYLINTNTGFDDRIALRKPGAAYDPFFKMLRNSLQSVIVGLDTQRRFEARQQLAGQYVYYIMGYTGRRVVFLDTPISIKPAANNIYSTFDIATQLPGAQLVLTDNGSEDDWGTYHSIRPNGSTKEIYQAALHKWPFCWIPPDGKIQTKLYVTTHATTRWLIYAYFKQNITGLLNGQAITPVVTGSWQLKTATGFGISPRFAFVESLMAASSAVHGLRKKSSWFADYRAGANHAWMITHVNKDRRFEIYSASAVSDARILATSE